MVDDEVLLNKNEELSSEKVSSVSNLIMQGNLFVIFMCLKTKLITENVIILDVWHRNVSLAIQNMCSSSTLKTTYKSKSIFH